MAFYIVSTLLLTWCLCHVIRKLAPRCRLVQTPNHRSSHIAPTPNGGGLGFVIIATIAALWIYPDTGTVLPCTFLLAGILALVGLWDDIAQLSAKLRFLLQIAVTALFLFLLGPLPVFHGVLLALVVIGGVWWINLFNFMDGIDGIAAVQGCFMLVAGAGLATLTSTTTDQPLWGTMIIVAAATCGFLLINWAPAKIFMGDVGSTWLAFMIFALALCSVQAGWLTYPCWLILGATFITDATMTLCTRVIKGIPWHEAHRSHAYQRLSRHWDNTKKQGHKNATLLYLTINILWLLPFASLTLYYPELAALWLCIAYIPLIIVTFLLGAGQPDDVKSII